SILLKRSRVVGGRSRQQQVGKAYCSSFPTTREPIKPLDHATRIRSSCTAIYSDFIPRARSQPFGSGECFCNCGDRIVRRSELLGRIFWGPAGALAPSLTSGCG